MEQFSIQNVSTEYLASETLQWKIEIAPQCFFFCLSWKGVEVVCSTKVLIITINGIIYDRLMPLL